MRLTTLLVTALTAGVLASVGLAGSTVRDPLSFTLRTADVPAGTTGTAQRSPAAGLAYFGVRGLTAANYAYTLRAGGSVNVPAVGSVPKIWRVEGSVWSSPTVAGAKQLFQLGRRTGSGAGGLATGDNPSPTPAPAYGDEQLVVIGSTRSQGVTRHFATAFARKGTLVWQVTVSSGPDQWGPSKAATLAVLRTYATKQKTRVGAGR